MESSDILMMKSLIDKDGMSDYEQSMLSHKQGCRPNGTSVAAITIGSAALLAAIGAWVFAPVYANAKACGNAQLIGANQAHTQQMLTLLATNAASERAERINQLNLSNKTIVDIISGATSLAGANASSAALAQAEATLLSSALMGNVSCPQKVSLYSAPQPCGCPVSCGCNG